MKVRIFGIIFTCFFYAASVSHVFPGDVEGGNDAGKAKLDTLKTLPYLNYTADKGDTSLVGVILYDEPRACSGYNIIASVLGTRIMDMHGIVLWSSPHWTHLSGADRNGFFAFTGQYALERHSNIKIGKYSWDSKSAYWESPSGDFHHGFVITSAGTILTIRAREYPRDTGAINFDDVIEMTVDGREIRCWSTYDHLDDLKALYPPEEETVELPNQNIDYFHVNSVQDLPETPIAKNDKRFRKGNWLVSLSYKNLIVILDRDTQAIVWSWGPDDLDFLHSPTMIANGHIIVFDNGKHRKYSRIIEMDPVSGKIIWEYKSDPETTFFSEARGFVQSLENGNVLVTDSNSGHVFEITRAGETVWDWYSPVFSEESKREVVSVGRRLTREEALVDQVIGKTVP